ncbi:MAG: hypothetical protein GF311_20830 [Candidatus Lokiarchaeota archaeon]|nr:hypothetical protein [Candidatus Lokiarchaeota archaeon]
MEQVLKTGIQDLNYVRYHELFPQFGRYEIENVIKQEWGPITKTIIHFQRELVIELLRRGKSDEYILKVLGYSDSTISRQSKIDRTFGKLFNGMTANEVGEYFTQTYLDSEEHFIWYNDLEDFE